MIVLPKEIYLTAMSKRWKVSYIHTPGKLSLLELPHRKLVVYGKHYSKRAAINLLIKWIKIKSTDYLTALLLKINTKVNADYNKVKIHSLKLEWGSVSSNKIVGLNYKLIFLPPKLVRYIIIHELCHTRYLDHSKEFWKEVEKFSKNWKQYKYAPNTADSYIPEWVIT